MNKPEGFDDIQLGTALTVGGHKCVIKKVEETRSQSGHEMIVIYYDTDMSDTQPEFFTNKFLKDRESGRDATWKGRHWIVTDGEYGPANLKRFTTAVEDSNPGFAVQWGPTFAGCFTGKKVGIVFRLEEYIDPGTYELRASVKSFRFCNYDKAYEQKIPDRKALPQNQQAAASWQPPQIPQTSANIQNGYEQMSFSAAAPNQAAADEGFMTVDPLLDEGLPFH